MYIKRGFAFVLACILILSVSSSVFAAENLAANPSFEDRTTEVPDNWSFWEWKDTSGIRVVEGSAHTGSYCVEITSNSENDARLVQRVKVSENSQYKLTCWVRTENVGEVNTGANISIEGKLERSNDLKGTNTEWTLLEMYVKTGSKVESANITLGLGGYGSTNTGKAYFDDFTMEEVDTIPGNASVVMLENTPQEKSQTDMKNEANKPSSPRNPNTIRMVLIFAMLLAAGALIFSVYSERKNPKQYREKTETKVYEGDIIPGDDSSDKE